MPQSSSDYSQLIEAILRNERKAADELAASLIERVVIYLKVRMGAPQSVAEECAYQAFSEVFEIIRKDRIEDKKSIFKYFIIAARNEYIRLQNSEHKLDMDSTEMNSSLYEPAAQLQNLIDEERQKLLKQCLDKLSDLNKRFILTFFSDKSVNMIKIAQKFGFSYGKTRTLKTRIVQELNQCVQKLSS